MFVNMASDDACKNAIGKLVGDGIVFFHAGFAGPSVVMRKTLMEYAMEDGFDIICVDITRCPDTAAEFEIKAVPTTFFYRDGTPIRAIKGNLTAAQIQEYSL